MGKEQLDPLGGAWQLLAFHFYDYKKWGLACSCSFRHMCVFGACNSYILYKSNKRKYTDGGD